MKKARKVRKKKPASLKKPECETNKAKLKEQPEFDTAIFASHFFQYGNPFSSDKISLDLITEQLLKGLKWLVDQSKSDDPALREGAVRGVVSLSYKT